MKNWAGIRTTTYDRSRPVSLATGRLGIRFEPIPIRLTICEPEQPEVQFARSWK
jgi:hypothetical protein